MDHSAQRDVNENLRQTPSPSFEELAALQCVSPITDFAALLGTPAPGDESAEEFAAMLRSWRHEGTKPRRSQ